MKDPIMRVFIAEIKGQLGRRVKKIILFGSRARRDGGEESDYDFLLILDEVTSEVERSIEAVCGMLLCDHAAVVSAFALSEADLERMKFEPFIMNVRRDGVGVG